MTGTAERLFGILEDLSGKGLSPELTQPLSSFVDDSLVLLEFILKCEDEFDIDLQGFEDHIEYGSTLAEIVAVLDARMAPK